MRWRGRCYLWLPQRDVVKDEVSVDAKVYKLHEQADVRTAESALGETGTYSCTGGTPDPGPRALDKLGPSRSCDWVKPDLQEEFPPIAWERDASTKLAKTPPSRQRNAKAGRVMGSLADSPKIKGTAEIAASKPRNFGKSLTFFS